MDLSHDQLQAACWKAAQRLYYPFMAQRLYCIPNDMHAGNIARWKQYEALGVTPGVWDMCLHWVDGIHWFEFKVGADKLSPAQLKFKERMLPLGHKFYIVETEQQFHEQLKNIIEPTLHIAKEIWKEELEKFGKKK